MPIFQPTDTDFENIHLDVFHVYYSKFLRENLAKNKPRVEGQFGVRENPNNALTGPWLFIGTKLIVKTK